VRAPKLRLGAGGARRRLGAGLALLVAIAVVVVIVLTTGSSPSSPAAATNASDTSGVATVERQNLIETDTEAGTLSYSDPQTVYNRLSGTITWLPSVGQEIRPGGTLYKVDGEPVIMLNGSTPAFRKMRSGMSAGADVLQLNRNLVRLGFNPDGIVIDDIWQPATTAGVEQFQDSLGESATGSLPLGQVVFLPGDQLITTVDGTLGAAGGGGGSPPSSDTNTPVAPSQPEFVDLKLVSTPTTPTTPTTSTTSTTSTTTTSTTTTPSGGTGSQTKKKKTKNSESRQTLAALIALLKAEIAQLKAASHPSQGSPGAGAAGNPSHPKSSSPKKGSSPSKDSPKASGGGGGGGGSATAILQTTSTHLVVTVDLGASVQSEAVVGEHVQVQMPAGNFVGGKITAVSSIAQSSSSGNGDNSGGSGGGGGGGGSGGGSGGSSSTIPVTVTLTGHHSGAGLDQAAVSVNFAQQRANQVLSVPVTALLATSGGKYAVQESAAPHKLIPATTGLFAAGYVQVSGAGIYPGLQVTDSQG
jgi:peptidoglycan hydrolase-like protein with peptidoglycan-binding domain